MNNISSNKDIFIEDCFEYIVNVLEIVNLLDEVTTINELTQNCSN